MYCYFLYDVIRNIFIYVHALLCQSQSTLQWWYYHLQAACEATTNSTSTSQGLVAQGKARVQLSYSQACYWLPIINLAKLTVHYNKYEYVWDRHDKFTVHSIVYSNFAITYKFIVHHLLYSKLFVLTRHWPIQPRSQASRILVLRFAFSIIHGSGRAWKTGKAWSHSSREWYQVDAM